MKHFNFLSVAIAAVLMVVAVGCTTMTETQDDMYSRTQGAERIYVDDPRRGTVVLERDPWSGRYYEVNSYGIYNNRYGRGYGNNGYYGRGYNNRNNRGNYNRGNQTPQQPTAEQKRQNEQNKNEARKKILGN